MINNDEKAWTCINRWQRRGYAEQTAIFENVMSELSWLRKRVAELNHHIDLLQTRLYLNKIPHRVEGIDDVSDSQNI